MKILHIIQRYPPAIGGSEVWCQNVCRYSAGKGHQITVLTLNVYKEEEFWLDPPIADCLMRFGKIEYDGKIKVIRCKRTKIPHLVFGIFKAMDILLNVYLYGPHSIEMYLRMPREIKDSDIVHLHTIPYPHNIIGLLLAKLLKKKVVITPLFHIGHRYYEKKSHFWLMKMCDTVFALTEHEKNYLVSKGLKTDNIVVTHIAVDHKDYLAKDLEGFKEEFFKKYDLNTNTRIIVFVGRKIEYKGLDTLIDAVKLLRESMPVKLFLIGPSFPWFKDYYGALSQDEKKDIVDLGVVSQQVKVNLMHLANLLVLPSKFESFGIVFLEAWLCGIPVIGCDEGVLPEIIKGGGLIFKHKDTEDLKEKINTLLSDASLSK